MTKHWRAVDSAVRKGNRWEVGICEGSAYHGRIICTISQSSEEEAKKLAKEVAEAVNSIRRMKATMKMAGLDEDRLLADMIKERES